MTQFTPSENCVFLHNPTSSRASTASPDPAGLGEISSVQHARVNAGRSIARGNRCRTRRRRGVAGAGAGVKREGAIYARDLADGKSIHLDIVTLGFIVKPGGDGDVATRVGCCAALVEDDADVGRI